MKNESHRSKSGVLAFAQVAFFSKNLSNFVFEQIWPKSTKLPKISFSADSTYEYPHSFFKFSPKNVSDPSYRCLKSCDFQKLRTIKNFQFWNMNSVWSIPYLTWIWESTKLGISGNFGNSHDRPLPQNWEVSIFNVNSHSQIQVK